MYIDWNSRREVFVFPVMKQNLKMMAIWWKLWHDGWYELHGLITAGSVTARPLVLQVPHLWKRLYGKVVGLQSNYNWPVLVTCNRTKQNIRIRDEFSFRLSYQTDLRLTWQFSRHLYHNVWIFLWTVEWRSFPSNARVFKILCFVDRAFLYNLVNKSNLGAPVWLYLQEKRGFSLYHLVVTECQNTPSLLLE